MTDQIKGYHSHIYFDADTVQIARDICEAVRDRFGAEMGRMHERPVGPHPMWSCQLHYGTGAFAGIAGWLAINRQGLTVFTHPITGDDLADHRDHAIWMGSMPALNLEVFTRSRP